MSLVTHELSCRQAEQALRLVFEDDSVPVEQTRVSLQDLRKEIDIMIDAVSYDVK